MPVRVPPAVGVNVTLIAQCAPAARLEPQLLLCAKSPLAATAEILRAAFPEFVSVIAWLALVVPCAWLANVKLVGERAADGAVTTPVPVRPAVCGLPVALSETETVAERAPLALGVKETVMEQLLPAARLEPQLFVCWKSAGFVPASVIPEIVRAALPVFVSVTLLVGLVVPTICEPNGKLAGESAAEGALTTPVPVRPAVCGLPIALSETETVAERTPLAPGVKETVMEQLLPAARLEPQLFVCRKSPGFVPANVIPEIVRAALPVFVSVIL